MLIIREHNVSIMFKHCVPDSRPDELPEQVMLPDPKRRIRFQPESLVVRWHTVRENPNRWHLWRVSMFGSKVHATSKNFLSHHFMERYAGVKPRVQFSPLVVPGWVMTGVALSQPHPGVHDEDWEAHLVSQAGIPAEILEEKC